MSEKSQILFMQTRLIRLASETWNMPVEKILDIFDKCNILNYYVFRRDKRSNPRMKMFMKN